MGSRRYGRNHEGTWILTRKPTRRPKLPRPEVWAFLAKKWKHGREGADWRRAGRKCEDYPEGDREAWLAFVAGYDAPERYPEIKPPCLKP